LVFYRANCVKPGAYIYRGLQRSLPGRMPHPLVPQPCGRPALDERRGSGRRAPTGSGSARLCSMARAFEECDRSGEVSAGGRARVASPSSSSPRGQRERPSQRRSDSSCDMYLGRRDVRSATTTRSSTIWPRSRNPPPRDRHQSLLCACNFIPSARPQLSICACQAEQVTARAVQLL
jgi:hypothetical protein